MSGSRLVRGFYYSIRGACIVTPWLLQLAAADVILSGLLPVSALFPSLAYHLSSYVAESVWKAVQFIFTRVNAAKITISGTKLPEKESAIVVCNHVSWSDFYMIQALAIRSRMLGRSRWFAKQQLKWVPFLGWGLWAMGMPLVSRNWLQDQREMNRVFGGIVDRQWPIWLISYSEATRFTTQKFDEAVQWCKTHQKPLPRHTLHPRTKGFVATVKQLRHAVQVKAVYDVTVAYARGQRFMSAPDIWETLSVPALHKSMRFHAHVERFPMESLPESDEALAQWLEDRWVEKGERLEVLRDQLARGLPWHDAVEQ